VPLPPEIQERLRGAAGETQLPLKTPLPEKVVIEGKTGIPFGVFVKLILKRKVQVLFRKWQEEPVILSSELLTSIASAPEDTPEDRSKVTLTALVLGCCLGMFLTATVLVLLASIGIVVGMRELLTGLGVLLFLAIAVYAAMKIQVHRIRQDVVDTVERVADVFSK
jgi:hypothetical protein